MAEHIRTLTTRSQVSVPAEVQQLLGVAAGDQVTFIIKDGEVRLVSARATLESVFGSIKPLLGEHADDFDAQIRLAKEERAEQAMKELRHE